MPLRVKVLNTHFQHYVHRDWMLCEDVAVIDMQDGDQFSILVSKTN